MMFNAQIPDQWLSLKLGDVVDYGKTEKAEPENIRADTWVLELEDIEKDSSKLLARLRFKDRQSRSTKNCFNKDDVLYGKLRPYLNKVIVADSEGVCSTEIVPLSGEPHLSNRYLFHWLKHPEFLDYVNSAGYGVNMPRLGTKEGLEAPFVLAPLAEQKQIAAKLDELLAQVDTLAARLEAIPQILKRFRQSVLAAAVSGRLTEEWRQLFPRADSQEDLKEVLEERAKFQKKTPEPHLESEVFDVPATWVWASLDSLTRKIVDGTHHTPTYTESGIPFISVKDIQNGRINFSSTKYISKEEHEELYKRCGPERGDLLITKSGTIGRTAIIDTDEEFSLFVSVALVKPASSKVNLNFINLALQKWISEIDVSSRIVGTAIKNLHLKDMKVLAIPFPPLQEQTQIVQRVEELFAFADQIEQRAKAAARNIAPLRQSILAKAFRGELTAQWRKENPELISGENSAQVLLDRIRAGRLDHAGRNKKRAK